MSSYGLHLSPAQAPLNCFGPSLSSRILSRLRPRHTRKTEYNNRLREGDACMTEARDIFQACQHALGHETRTTIQVNLEGLRIERDRLYKFSDYGGSQQAEEGALSRAEAYRTNATRAYAMVTAARNAALSAPGSLPHARGLSTSVHSPSGSHRSGTGSGGGSGSGTQRMSNEHVHTSARSNHASLPRTPPYAEEPLQMLQTRAGPVAWTPGTPALGNNILGLDAMGVRASPHTFKNAMLRTIPAGSTTPAGSILSLDMSLVGISSMQRSPASLHSSPADSVGAYSLGSDGFPRPSRRVPQRRGTIQSTTSLPRSNPSRQGSTQTHSSHASSVSGGPRSSRQSSVQTSHSSHSRPSLDGAKHPSSYQSRRSDDRRSRPAYARAPSSLRTSSVPPENRASPYGVPRITDSPGRYYN